MPISLVNMYYFMEFVAWQWAFAQMGRILILRFEIVSTSVFILNAYRHNVLK